MAGWKALGLSKSKISVSGSRDRTGQAEPLELSYTIPWGQDPVSHRERKVKPVPHRDVHQQVDAGKDAGVGCS